jgi:hypothetical protein
MVEINFATVQKQRVARVACCSRPFADVTT